MKLIELGNPVDEPRTIVRRLQDGPDYRPDWRSQVVEQYLLDIAQANQKFSRVAAILEREGDPYVRQLLRFHCGWRCVIHSSIEYAVRCGATNNSTRIGSVIRAMTLSGCTAEQIGREVGADLVNVVTYQKIFFDIKRYLDQRAWLKQLCFPGERCQLNAEASETRWLQIAFASGWRGLAPIVSKSCELPSITGKAALISLVQMLVSRVRDYFTNLEMAGAAPTERELQLLIVLNQRIEALGLPLALKDLDFIAPLDPEEERRQIEARKIVSKLPLRVRQKLTAFLQKLEVSAASAESKRASQNEKKGFT